MTPLELRAESLLDELMEKYPLPQRPALIWKPLRVTAGVAYYKSNSIGLSRNLLTDAERLDSTLIHEYAHLLAVHRHGKKAANHGQFWKDAMKDLGAPPERTHCYQVQRNQVRQQVTYECAKCGKKFFKRRRFPKRQRFFHIDCGGGLRLVSVEIKTSDHSAP